MVNSTWTVPGGATCTLSGSSPLWIGSYYQTKLDVVPIHSGTYMYTCTAFIDPFMSVFLVQSNPRSSDLDGKHIINFVYYSVLSIQLFIKFPVLRLR